MKNQKLTKCDGNQLTSYLIVYLCCISELTSGYLPSSPHHLGYKYKKVVYVEYTDSSFTVRKSSDTTFFGPQLKGKVNDQFQVCSSSFNV